MEANQPKPIRDWTYKPVGGELLPDNLPGYARNLAESLNHVGAGMSGISSPPTGVMSSAIASPLLSIQSDVDAGADKLERVFTDEGVVLALCCIEAEYPKIGVLLFCAGQPYTT